jgi:hypothetical protein
VPNHAGLDHPWLIEHPERFMPGRVGSKESFPQDGPGDTRWIAHAKDPWFPAWIDTAQVDVRLAETRAALIGELRAVARRCDGVRCDMSMLLLNDVFARTWSGHPRAEATVPGEFWAEAIAACRRPGFLFLAEAYWDMEERLQALGFDYTYDKRVTDFVVEENGAGLQRHLVGKSRDFLQRSVHFIENHDEPRVAGRLGLAAHRAASLLILGLPGMHLLHDGQLAGAKVRASVHLQRRLAEPTEPFVSAWYQELLEALPRSRVGRGEGRILQPSKIHDDSIWEQAVVVRWHGDDASGCFDLLVVNITPAAGRCRIDFPPGAGEIPAWTMRSRLQSSKERQFVRAECRPREGILLDIPPYGTEWLEIRPSGS